MKLRPFFSNDFFSNVYLIEDKKNLLIDAGTRPLNLPKIDILVLTHCHLDHITMAKNLQEKTKCEIWMSEAEAKFFENNRKEASASQFFKTSANFDFKINKRLRAGDVINLGKTKLEAIVTPGHTPGSLCLYEPKSKTLFSGDTVFAQGYGRYDLLGGNASALNESIKNLSKLDAEELYPGHGPARKGGVGAYLKSIEVWHAPTPKARGISRSLV